MPTNLNDPQLLTGLDAFFAGQPMSTTMRGGANEAFNGSSAPPTPNAAPTGAPPAVPGATPEQSPFAGMGSYLEDDDKAVFKTIHELVQRQELIAKNHLAQDTHWTRVKLGYPWSTLEKVPDQDIYRATLPYGTTAVSIQAVPNKSWDLVNKAAETLLVDFPKPEPSALNDSEEAERSAEMAEKFLVEDGGENGTNDSAVFYQAVDKSLTCASSYIHVWTDPTGGGSVPLQIKAHPLAVDANNPLLGPDGMPTTDYILRYVTAHGQFTEQPSEAAPSWQPQERCDIWGREHVRVFPETADISNAEKVIALWYCTVGEAKRRWKTVAALSPADLSSLCDWTPTRYLSLLPPFQRARWKLNSGADEKQRSGSADERTMFFYLVYQRSTPDYPKGAAVVVTGAQGGKILDRQLLSATVQVTGHDGGPPKSETRCLDLPIIQVRPRLDADDRDPSGRAYIELFGGATEFNATLAMAYLEAMDITLHVEKYIPSTSPVEGWQITEARASGDAIAILGAADKPIYGQVPPVPTDFLSVMEWGDTQQESIASLNKPVQGSDNQQEVSGTARRIAVQQAMIGLNRMQQAVNAAAERYWRIKIQLAMRDFSAPQQIRYVGEDGAYKQAEWTGKDFALIGDVGIKAGTGTMMTPEAKVQYAGSLAQVGMMNPEDAQEAARPSFAQSLGIPDNPHDQYIERCVAAWFQGPPQGNPQSHPPTPGWIEQHQAYQQQEALYQQEIAPEQQAYQHVAQQAQMAGQSAPPPPQLPPGPQQPWTPFAPRANDNEPEIAMKWFRRLSRVISSVRYDAMPPEWRAVLDQRYLAAQQVVALATAPPPQPGAPGQPGAPSHASPHPHPQGAAA